MTQQPINLSNASSSHQSGATLLISLILLIAISIVSLVSMRTSLLDLVITNNKQQFANTFEAAEQVTSTRFSTMDFSVTGTELTGAQIINFGSVAVSSKDSDGDAVQVATVNSEVRYRTQGPTTGWELDQYGAAYHFQLNVEADSLGRGANSNHQTGFFIIAPSAE